MQIQRQTNLTANLVAFCRFLRQNEFVIGLSEEQDALSALQMIDPFGSPEELQLCLQATLCRNPRQLARFPKLYQHFWRELDRAVDSKTEEKLKKKQVPTRQKKRTPSLQTLKNWLYGNQQTEEVATATYSDGGTGQITEQVAFSTDELKEIFRLVGKLVQKVANRRSRRFRATQKQGTLDLQKTIRKNINRQAELVEIVNKRKKKDQLRVVLLCDVSRSMELYSRFFIQFMYAFQSRFSRVEAFAFANELHQITQELNHRSIGESLEKVMQKIPDWSGGTRIGTSLRTFNEKYAHRFLTRKTLVLILSDGWDADAIDLVGENMKKIHRKALQVVWLNPLAGSSDWQPEVRGMKAALPYIDALLPFYNIESLRKVVREWRV